MNINYLDHLPKYLIDDALHLYLTALSDKFVPIFTSIKNAHDTLQIGINCNHCLAAISGNSIVGILGVQTKKGSFLNPKFSTLVKTYGIVGGAYRMAGLALLHHFSVPQEMYIDGIAVAEQCRGAGIGTALIHSLENMACKNNYHTITLEVINTNARAKKLYNRLGFNETKSQTVWPFNTIYGFPFQSSTQMVKKIDASTLNTHHEE